MKRILTVFLILFAGIQCGEVGAQNTATIESVSVVPEQLALVQTGVGETVFTTVRVTITGSSGRVHIRLLSSISFGASDDTRFQLTQDEFRFNAIGSFPQILDLRTTATFVTATPGRKVATIVAFTVGDGGALGPPVAGFVPVEISLEGASVMGPFMTVSITAEPAESVQSGPEQMVETLLTVTAVARRVGSAELVLRATATEGRVDDLSLAMAVQSFQFTAIGQMLQAQTRLSAVPLLGDNPVITIDAVASNPDTGEAADLGVDRLDPAQWRISSWTPPQIVETVALTVTDVGLSQSTPGEVLETRVEYAVTTSASGFVRLIPIVQTVSGNAVARFVEQSLVGRADGDTELVLSTTLRITLQQEQDAEVMVSAMLPGLEVTVAPVAVTVAAYVPPVRPLGVAIVATPTRVEQRQLNLPARFWLTVTVRGAGAGELTLLPTHTLQGALGHVSFDPPQLQLQFDESGMATIQTIATVVPVGEGTLTIDFSVADSEGNALSVEVMTATVELAIFVPAEITRLRMAPVVPQLMQTLVYEEQYTTVRFTVQADKAGSFKLFPSAEYSAGAGEVFFRPAEYSISVAAADTDTSVEAGLVVVAYPGENATIDFSVSTVFATERVIERESLEVVVAPLPPPPSAISITVDSGETRVNSRAVEVDIGFSVTLEYLDSLQLPRREMLVIEPVAEPNSVQFSPPRLELSISDVPFRSTFTVALAAVSSAVITPAVADSRGTPQLQLLGSHTVVLEPELLRAEIEPLQALNLRSGDQLTATITVRALDLDGQLFDPRETLVLYVLATTNITTISSAALSFSAGIAIHELPLALTDRYSDAMVELAVGRLSTGTAEFASESLFVRGRPLLTTITVTAQMLQYRVNSPVAVTTVQLVVSLGFAGDSRPAVTTISLSIDSDNSEARFILPQLLEFSNSDTLSLDLGIITGDVEQTAAELVIGRVDEAVQSLIPSIVVVFRPELASFAIDAPDEVQQSDVGRALTLIIALTALGTDNRPFDPDDAVFTISEGDTVLSRLTPLFNAGSANLQIDVMLPRSGFHSEVVLTISDPQSGLGTSRTVSLRAVPAITELLLSAERSQYSVIADHSTAVIALSARLVFADSTNVSSPTLALSAVASTETVAVLFPEELEFNGEMELRFAVEVVLSGVRSTTLTLGFDNLAAGIDFMPLELGIELRPELASVVLESTRTWIQSAADEDFAVSLAVVITGSDGRPFEAQPGALQLLVRQQSNLLPMVMTQVLNFSEGRASVDLQLGLEQQGRNAMLALALVDIAAPELELTTATLNFRALPVLESVEIVPVQSRYNVVRPDQQVSIGLTVTLNYVDNLPLSTTTLAFEVETSTDSVTIVTAPSQLPIPAAGVLTFEVVLTLGNNPDASVNFGLGDDFPVPVNSVGVTLVALNAISRVELRLLGSEALIRQSFVGEPVTFRVALQAFNSRDESIAVRGMGIRAASVEPGLGFTVTPPLQDIAVGGSEFEISATLPGRAGTAVLSVFDPEGRSFIANTLTVPLVPSATMLDIDDDGAVSAADLLFCLRWFSSGAVDTLEMIGSDESLFSNSEIDADSFTAEALNNLTLIYTAPAAEGQMMQGDVDRDGTVTELDLRLLLRYRAGLRGRALGMELDEQRERSIRQLLGVP